MLVINKPAGLVCHPSKNGECSSLIGRLRLHLRTENTARDLAIHPESQTADFASSIPPKSDRNGSRFTPPTPRPAAHLVNRLDRETSGIVIAALNRQAAGELGRLWETRAVHKEYLAIVHGAVLEEYGIIDAPLGRDHRSRVAIKDCVCADGASARTEYWVEQRFTCAIRSWGTSFTAETRTFIWR